MKPIFRIIFKDIIQFLDSNLPSYLTYHNTEHTLYVLEKVIHIAHKEKVKTEDLELLKVAALFHDIGFTKTHLNHEEASCKIAKIQLKNYGYSSDKINKICGMIMATKIPQKPQNHLEEILADADLEYLATSQFWKISDLLYKEYKHFNTNLSIKEWNKIQIDFINQHKFHTTYCKHYKKFRKLRNLKKIDSQNSFNN